MTHPLDITFSIPLEREYEAWIIRGIEEYFLSLGQCISIWAVSPMDEVNWPADESMIIGKKLIGLQMKKVDYKNNGTKPRKFGRLRWSFHNPKGQFDLVVKFPEIFYCLPTFINRDLKDQALSHCLFWRPDPKTKRNLNAWYDNSNAHTPHNSIGTADRWGKFIESIVECSIGKKIESFSEAKNYVKDLMGYMQETVQLSSNNIFTETDDHEISREPYVYVLAIPINS